MRSIYSRSLDGIMYLIDSIGEGRIWCPEADRTDRHRWLDSSVEEIPEGYDILAFGDLIRTYGPIEGNGFVPDPEGCTLSITRCIRIDTEGGRLIVDLDPALCREIQEAMREVCPQSSEGKA